MKKYRHLTFEDRIYIEVWYWEGKSVKYISECLSVSPTTISRELVRGRTNRCSWGWGYRADLGERHKVLRGRAKGAKPKIVGELERLVKELIRLDWSPEQISGRLRAKNIARVSHETIYRYLAKDRNRGGKLYLHLRRSHRRRKKRLSVPRIRTDILHRRHISTRPAIINDRTRLGDWERDLVFAGSRSEALLTFVDRKSLLSVLRRVGSKSPKEIAAKTIEAMSGQHCLSITNDNGFEFRAHEFESEKLKVPIYFSNPYSSWERGTNENTNGLIRQYLPKKGNIKEMSNDKIKWIENRLNTRPRKKLGFQTPLEASTCSSTCPLQEI